MDEESAAKIVGLSVLGTIVEVCLSWYNCHKIFVGLPNMIYISCVILLRLCYLDEWEWLMKLWSNILLNSKLNVLIQLTWGLKHK